MKYFALAYLLASASAVSLGSLSSAEAESIVINIDQPCESDGFDEYDPDLQFGWDDVGEGVFNIAALAA